MNSKLLYICVIILSLLSACREIDYIHPYYAYSVYNTTEDTVMLEVNYSKPNADLKDSVFMVYPKQTKEVCLVYPMYGQESDPSIYMESLSIMNNNTILYVQKPIQDSLWQVIEKINVDNPQNVGVIVKYQLTYPIAK